MVIRDGAGTVLRHAHCDRWCIGDELRADSTLCVREVPDQCRKNPPSMSWILFLAQLSDAWPPAANIGSRRILFGTTTFHIKSSVAPPIPRL
jgi:hypothetical protein